MVIKPGSRVSCLYSSPLNVIPVYRWGTVVAPEEAKELYRQKGLNGEIVDILFGKYPSATFVIFDDVKVVTWMRAENLTVQKKRPRLPDWL